MRKLALLTFAAAMSTSTLALADHAIVTVDLTDIRTALATELNVDPEDVPSEIQLSAELAAVVCGVDVASLEDSCVAVSPTADLVAAIGNDDDNPTAEPNANSARAFAPGQQEGSAKDAAPGQQEGDAKDHAPGQLKKDAGSDGSEDSTDE